MVYSRVTSDKSKQNKFQVLLISKYEDSIIRKVNVLLLNDYRHTVIGIIKKEKKIDLLVSLLSYK